MNSCWQRTFPKEISDFLPDQNYISFSYFHSIIFLLMYLLCHEQAVNSITWSNAMTEASGHLRFHTAYHMDGESLLKGHELLQGRYQELVGSIIMDQSYSFARELLGTSLNGIQVSPPSLRLLFNCFIIASVIIFS